MPLGSLEIEEEERLRLQQEEIDRIMNRSTATETFIPLSNDMVPRHDDRSGRELLVPRDISKSLLTREGLTQNNDGYDNFGSERGVPESGIQESINNGLEYFGFEGGLGDPLDIIEGAASFGSQVLTKMPAVLLKEFSDIIGDDGREIDGFIGDAIGMMDDVADDWSESLMMSYRRSIAESNVALGENGEPTFLFQLGAGGASLGTAVALTAITRSPKITAMFFGALQQSETYLNAIEAGKEPREALVIASGAGLGAGLTEFIGIRC